MADPVQISDLKNNVPVKMANVQPGFGDLHSFELMQRGAKVLAASSLVPEQFRGAEGLPNAIVALNMALRMQADPLMVMQNLYVVHGRPAWSAQFLIATFNRSGRYSALRYEWQSERGKDSWGCRAWAIELATGDKIVGPLVTMQTAKDEKWIDRAGSKWKTIPELMLTYRAAAWFVRTNAPEIAMGLPTADEQEDIVTLTRDQYTVAAVAAGEHAQPEATKPAETAQEAATGAPAELSYAVVAEYLNTAHRDKDADQLDSEAANSIPLVADPVLREELNKLYRELRADLNA